VSINNFTLHNLHFVFYGVGNETCATQHVHSRNTGGDCRHRACACDCLLHTPRLSAIILLGFLATAPVAFRYRAGRGLVLHLHAAAVLLYGTLWILLIAFVTLSMPAAISNFSRPSRRCPDWRMLAACSAPRVAGALANHRAAAYERYRTWCLSSLA
jgi:iron(III) transport system permease protein